MDGCDLLLLSDEYSPAGNEQYEASLDRLLYGGLDISEQEAKRVTATYDVDCYLRPRGRSTADGTRTYSPVLPHKPSAACITLATVARKEGFEVAIIDNFIRYPWRMQQAIDFIEREKIKFVGLSSTFLFEPTSLKRVAKIVRDMVGDRAKLVLGGPTVRNWWQDLQDEADYFVFGSGEEPMLGLLRAAHGRCRLEEVPRIAYRDAKGTMQLGPGAQGEVRVGVYGKPFQAVLGDFVPIPDWTLYSRSRAEVYPIEFSRGCKYNCFYCTYERGKVIRPLDEIRKELEINAALGICRYRVTDSNFSDGPARYPEYPHDICRTILDTGLELFWSSYARVDDVLHTNLAELMRDAGCYGVFFGIESGDDDVLRAMRKGHTVQDAYDGVARMKGVGIQAHANFVVGYPGETRKTFANTIEFIKRSRPNTVLFGKFRLDPIAPVSKPSVKKHFNIVGNLYDWSHDGMSSGEVNDLIAAGCDEIIAEGIGIGSTEDFCQLMGVGLTLEDVKQMIENTRLVGDEATSEPIRVNAAANKKKFFLETIPNALSEDVKLMKAAY